MKLKEKTALRQMTVSELMKRSAELAAKEKEFRLTRTTGQVKNTREGKTMRKTVALIKSVIREKELTKGTKQ